MSINARPGGGCEHVCTEDMQMARHTLNPHQLEHLATRLQARRHALSAQRQNHLGGQSRAEHAHEVLHQDGDDAPQRAADREIDLMLTDQEEVELGAIDAALERLAEGRYGLCEDCGESIPLQRLELAPQVQHCVGCQAVRERGRLRNASL